MKSYYLIVISCFLSFCGFSQETSFSPYSRFGIGELHGNLLNRQYSMGGTGTGVIDFFGVNPLNSASYAFISEPSFELGILSNWFRLDNMNESIDGNVTRVNHVAMGMPITSKKMGFSFGLIPISYVGYNINSTDSIGDSSFIQENLGEGGLNKLYLGFGKRFILKTDTVKFRNKEKALYTNSLALGFNFNYIFGNRTNISRSIFAPGLGFINTQVSNIDNTSDAAFDFGLLYSGWLKKRTKVEDGQIRFNLGISISPGTELSSKRTEIAESFVSNAAVQFFVDSILSNEDNEGFIFLPQELSIGTSFEFFSKRDNRLILALDYRTRPWEEYFENFGTDNFFSELINSTRLSAGLEYLPNWRLAIKGANIAPEDYLKSLHYRAGIYRNSGYLNLEGQEFIESGINFGVGLPLVRGRNKLTSSELNFGFEISQRGSIDNNLLKENNFEVFVGIRFNPNTRLNPWFVKRKYD